MSATTPHATALEIRQAITTALRAIPGLNAQPYVLSNLNPPTATVLRGPVEYDEAMAGSVHVWTFLVRVYVNSVTDIGSQTKLDEYVSADGESSVKAAIEADTTLGGLVMDLHVTGASGEQELVRDPTQGGPLLFSEWTVQVWF